mmetsp:Transcript_29830/g.62333  ORF Transcript_29830/g.62333 Transcript_29830/m.62333 type:complete len:93 (+) Transcript_29830:314-592(+)
MKSSRPFRARELPPIIPSCLMDKRARDGTFCCKKRNKKKKAATMEYGTNVGYASNFLGVSKIMAITPWAKQQEEMGLSILGARMTKLTSKEI